MFFDTLCQRALFMCFVLSAASLAAHLARIPYTKEANIDTFAEWVGHGPHGIGNAYMASVMLGWIQPRFFESLSYVYALCALIFAYRLVSTLVGAGMVFGRYRIWWYDLTHIIGSASHAYMFMNTAYWTEGWTIFFVGYQFFVIAIYGHYLRMHARETRPRIRRAHALSDLSHLAIAVTMIIMLPVMQWPIADCAMCISATSVHKH